MSGFITPPTRLVDLPNPSLGSNEVKSTGVNTRNALWPERWPAIALQSCIDEVEAAEPQDQAAVKRALPCQDCPESTRCLNAKAKEIGSLMYDREILTEPRTSESSLFPRELMRPMLIPMDSLAPHYRKPAGEEARLAVVQAWDIAWSEKVGGDWLVCMTAVVHLASGRRRLVDISRWQQKTFQQQIDLIEEMHQKYSSDLVVIEGDAAQKVWKQHTQETTNVPVMSHDAADGKTSLVVGVPSLLINFENRRWEFPFKEESYHRDNTDVFLAELEAFGWVDGKLQGVGEHDDTVMCFWHLDYGVRQFLGAGASEQHLGIQDGRSL